MDYSHLCRTCTEQTEPVKTEITGELPEWLRGKYFLNGLGKFENEDFKLNHLFDGYSMIVKFDIQQDVTFQSRFVNSDAHKKFMTHKRPVFQEFGTPGSTDPDRNALGRIFSKYVPLDLTDNVCSNIHVVGDELYACSETNYLWLIDQDTLEAKEKIDISKIVGVNVCSSHPHITDDGTMYNIGSSFGVSVKYHIIKIEPPRPSDPSCSERNGYRKGSILFTIPSRWSTCYGFYHSFGMTKNFFIFIEQCLTANVPKLITSQLKGRAIKECLEWSPQHNTRFILMDRNTGKVLKVNYMTEPMFMMHHVNAFEQDNDVIVDVIASSSSDILNDLYLNKLRQNNFTCNSDSQVRRYFIPIALGEIECSSENSTDNESSKTSPRAVLMKHGKVWVKPQLLSHQGFGLPAINYQFNNASRYNFIYGNGELGCSTHNSTLVKINVNEDSKISWKGPDDYQILEPTFVRKPDCQAEDDGILIAAAISLKTDHPSLLLFIDAVSMTEIAHVQLPPDIFLPFCFHGCFISNKNN